MTNHDNLESVRGDFARAEADWMCWRQIPSNHCEGHGTLHVSRGPLLLAKLIQTMAQYQAFVETETRIKIDNAARNDIPIIEISPRDEDVEIDIPYFLKRQTD